MENQGVEGVLVGGEEGTKKTITHNGYENRERREKKKREMERPPSPSKRQIRVVHR